MKRIVIILPTYNERDNIKQLITEIEKSVSKLKDYDTRILVVDDKWMTAIEQSVKGEMDRISQKLTGRIKELAERYATPLPTLTTEIEGLTGKVDKHLEKMGFRILGHEMHFYGLCRKCQHGKDKIK